MQKAPTPANESERIAAVKELHLLDTLPEERFDRITRLALFIFNVPISTITLVDSNREWYKSCQGLEDREADRAISFCGHAITQEGVLEIPNALEDERFKDNPMVISPPNIRYYIGKPLKSTKGFNVGTFCLKDTKPRQKLGSDFFAAFLALAAWAETEIRYHELFIALKPASLL